MDTFFHQLDLVLPRFWSGVWLTVEATLLGGALAFVLSFVLGLMLRSETLVLRGLARFVVEFFRGTSIFVQLFFLFYALPGLGFQLAPLFCGVLAFGLNYGAYGAEIVRGSINSIPAPQWEAGVALNMTAGQRMRRVILPQAWARMIPQFTNLLIQLLKDTPLLSLILMADVTYVMQQVRQASGNSIAAYGLVLLVYLVLAYLLTLIMNLLEMQAKAKLGEGRGVRGLFTARTAPGGAGSPGGEGVVGP
ncbi:ectoine/hydroxyectoine ABC transporter permease subunit EhuC [Mangrovactinospora gilvigrisea]|uniref:Ectoine/hydroxyectoine ABC transporter permease subunit EhuC n=1 Tax=Mangrovactinospora gilvigrisea TaxID=1428644 RepID=A0A1J7BI12_9ACTN|nr:ectoine/hydroxyectoine ABC transporter permease subunit EhuC [Mangrovactinospora gilvigrisea]OIV38311.1 ectoine/hydroxyectoine ABC transporter permease subunit EhuC [Mangrovactinospora gilvigrisea]